MQPRPIPFHRHVLPIVNEPTVMRRRLDFADWLMTNGYKPRAAWMRVTCNLCEARAPLAVSSPDGCSMLGNTPWYYGAWLVNFAQHNRASLLLERWNACRPEYWRQIDGVEQAEYFGRILFSVLCNPGEAVRRLGEAEWLSTAYREGWLEALHLRLRDAGQVRSLVEWPKPIRSLPILVDTLRCDAEGLDDRLLREVLSLDQLHGITFGPGEVAYACVKKFSRFAPNLRYLQLLDLRAVATARRMLEQLCHLRELRSLTVGGKLPVDEQMGDLTSIPNLQCLRLYGRQVTDQGLLALQAARALRVVVVDALRMTRNGIYALREARPDLQVVVVGEARDRLGPV